MPCLDLDGLRSFVAVVEASSFSRAAEIVGRSQSAVSLQLGRLERQLGKVLLLRRQGRILGLTEDGRELLPYARRMIDLNDAACRAVANGAVTGRVRLGVPADFMDARFPDVLRAFQHAQGGVELSVVSDVSQRLRERLHQGELDLAFFKRLPGGRKEGTVALTQSLSWMGNASTAVTAEDEPLPLVLFPEGCMFRAQALAALEASGRCWRVSYVCPSMDSLKTAIRSGLGVSVLPVNGSTGEFTDLGPQGLPPLGHVEVVALTGREGGRAARLLADHITRHIKANL